MNHRARSVRTKRLVLCVLAVIGIVPMGAGFAANAPTYTFGVVPQQSGAKLAQLWLPIVAYLKETTGYSIEFKTAANIPDFEKATAAGQYDFAYLNPYHYTVFSEAPGYVAFGKQKGKRIQGIVVVKADSSIADIADLTGENIAFPAPAAFAASVLPRAHFAAAKFDISPRYVESHDAVYRAVDEGLFLAGGGIQRTFNSLAPELRTRLRVLWKTETFTPHAFAHHPKVPKPVVDAVSRALVTMERNQKGAKLLRALRFSAGIESATDADWDDVRSLKGNILNIVENDP